MKKIIPIAAAVSLVVLVGVGCSGSVQTTGSTNTYNASNTLSSVTSTPPSMPSTTTIVIPEMNLTLVVPEELKDLEYIIERNPTNNMITATFTTKSLRVTQAERGGENNCTAKDAPLGSLTKKDKTLQFRESQATCSNDADVIKLQTKQRTALINGFANLKK